MLRGLVETTGAEDTRAGRSSSVEGGYKGGLCAKYRSMVEMSGST